MLRIRFIFIQILILIRPELEKIPTFFYNLFFSDYPNKTWILKIVIQTKKILNYDSVCINGKKNTKVILIWYFFYDFCVLKRLNCAVIKQFNLLLNSTTPLNSLISVSKWHDFSSPWKLTATHHNSLWVTRQYTYHAIHATVHLHRGADF